MLEQRKRPAGLSRRDLHALMSSMPKESLPGVSNLDKERERYRLIYENRTPEISAVSEAYRGGSVNHGRPFLPHLSDLVDFGDARMLLDVGTGRGFFPYEALKACPLLWGAVGVDLVDSFERTLLKSFSGRLTYHVAAAQALGLFTFESFDVVTSFDVLEHIHPDDVDLALEEMHRVAKWFTAHSICCRPSGFGDVLGRNLHLTVRPLGWWVDKLKRFGRVVEKDRFLVVVKS